MRNLRKIFGHEGKLKKFNGDWKVFVCISSTYSASALILKQGRNFSIFIGLSPKKILLSSVVFGEFLQLSSVYAGSLIALNTKLSIQVREKEKWILYRHDLWFSLLNFSVRLQFSLCLATNANRFLEGVKVAKNNFESIFRIFLFELNN